MRPLQYWRSERLLLMGCAAIVLCIRLDATYGQEVTRPTQILPTEALHQIFAELRETPDKQSEITKRIFPSVKTLELSSAEEFALGEVYFASLMPGKAKEIFTKFAKGRGLHARIARQRLMIMQMRVEDRYDDIEVQIEQYRRLFPPNYSDRLHLANPVSSLARHYQDTAQYEKAVRVIIDDFNSTPFDAPYRTFRLPAVFLTSFEKTGKKGVALQLLENARDGLRRQLKKDRTTELASAGASKVSHRKNTFHRIEEGLDADLDKEIQKAKFFRDILKFLDDEIAKMRKG